MRQNGREMSEEIMSHEVRTSIMSIIGVTELLNAEYKEHQIKQEINRNKRDYLDIILQNTKRLEKAINTELRITM
jgi:signal transduction histidine kinase